MGWTSKVTCRRCGGFDWSAMDGVWTCGCLHRMTTVEIAEYHRTLCACPAKDRVVVDDTCQTCRKPNS